LCWTHESPKQKQLLGIVHRNGVGSSGTKLSKRKRERRDSG
jgi:hypothetical protein